jgi:class 3 adenylate cyclase/tetratricopeptide (TPR) repeat protein
MLADAFIPEDRRAALAAGRDLPTRARGAALFADISGFTPLTEALARQLGPRRGAEVLTEQLNLVYSTLINAVERWQGSVIGFSGDAITCWFDDSTYTGHAGGMVAGAAATHCAQAMQTAMVRFAKLTLPGGVQASLALKTAIVSGPVSRIQVGEPAIQLIDVLAGGTLDALAAAEHAAQQGDVVVDLATLAALAGVYRVREQRRSSEGRDLAVLAAPAAAQFQPPALPVRRRAAHLHNRVSRQWVLPPVYARLHSEGSRFLAELRPATALFLRFGGLDFDCDPQAAEALDAFVRWVQGVVNAYGGAVIQLTTGDKGNYLYAAFGAPISGDEDMQRAVATALALRNPPPHLAQIGDICMGISQGMMRAGPYGSDTRITYGVLGDATNLAARLMMEAEAGQICISAQVAAAIADQFDLRDLGQRRLKGKSDLQPVFAVLGSRRQPAARAGEPAGPLLGRQAELGRLLQWAQAAASGSGGVVRLEGEAGAGKSHLAAHFGRAAEDIGVRVIVAGCQSTAQNSAYFAAQQWMRALLELSPITDAGADAGQGAAINAEIEQLAARLRNEDPTALLRLPLLGDLLGLPIPDNPTTAAFDARLRQEALTALVIDIVRRASQARPLALVIEDAHWLDEASRALVLALARTANSMALLLVLVQRPPDSDQGALGQELLDLPGQQHIRLAELDAEGTAQLVQRRLGGEVEPLAMNFVHSLAQGNPFFAEELVDALCEGDLLVQEQAAWRLSPALVDALRRSNCLLRVGEEWQLTPNAPLAAVDIGVPASIHGLVLSRLDRLPEASKLTLKVASVIGRVFEVPLLAAAHPNQPDAASLAEQFAVLQARDFARIETPQPRPAYIFKHNITQEVVYQTLLGSQRQELHVAIAQALEMQAPNDVERLAHHYGQGDTAQPVVRTKALHYIDAAGWRAVKEHANETALAYFDRALQMEMRWPWLKGRAGVLHILGRRLQEEATLLALDELGGGDPQQQLEGAVMWAQFYAATGDYTPASQALQRATALAVEQGDHHSQARCRNEQATIDWRQGDYAAAQHGYLAALQLSAGSDERLDVQGEAHYGLGLVYRQQSRYDAAREQFRLALSANRRLGDRQHEARTLNALGSVANLERDYAAAIDLFSEALRLREVIGDRAGVGTSLMSLAQVYGNLGDYSRVEPLLQQALEIQQAVRNRWEEMLVLNELGILYTAVGQYAQAGDYLAQALARSRSIESEIGAAYVLCNLSQAQRDGGKLADAALSLQEGLRLAQAQGDLNLEAIYLGDAALTSLRSGDAGAATAQAERSLTLFMQLDLPLSCTSVYATLAAARLALDDRDGAQAAVQAALALLDGCGGEGPDYPQRDYWQCAEVLAALGDAAGAARARAQAGALLHQRAERISDGAMRHSYLTQVAVHAEIGAVA